MKYSSSLSFLSLANLFCTKALNGRNGVGMQINERYPQNGSLFRESALIALKTEESNGSQDELIDLFGEDLHSWSGH
jgi:hypothetical protein